MGSASPSPTQPSGGLASSCRNPECGCPPYDGSNWCSEDTTNYGDWCSASKSNCEAAPPHGCAGTFCDVSLAQTDGKTVRVNKHEFLGVRSTSMIVVGSTLEQSDEVHDEL